MTDTEKTAAEPKSSGSKKAYLIFDGINYEGADGAWCSHADPEEPVQLPASEFKRLSELGAVSADSGEASAAREERAGLASAGLSLGSVPVDS